jgi:hypothetical protein
MSLSEIENTDSDKIESLWLAITSIEAQEQLKKLSVADWPNMKKAARTKMHKELFSKAYPSEIKKKNYITADQMQKLLGK